MLTSFKAVVEQAKNLQGKKIAVAGAEGEAVLEAVKLAKENGLMEPILVGHEDKINIIARKVGLSLKDIEIQHIVEETAAAEAAVGLIHSDRADGLLKGKVNTPILLKAILDRKEELCTGPLLSHVAILEISSYHKFLMVTDGGMVIQPTLEQKSGILKNGIQMMHKLGVERPKVAVLAAIETVTPGMPETKDAEILVQMADRGDLGNVDLEGPIALDVAFSPESARIKGVNSKISGDPDILLVPNISCGNIFVKGLWQLADAKVGGLILGAKKPIILLSRSDNAETKYNSIALGVVTS